mmetsp:Transcript_106865/g.228198  ORF Transcript_106865/g.228198 Transcript_106865/m.228198 type:complete len:297 (-) Transcript_106865:662-1552(-)
MSLVRQASPWELYAARRRAHAAARRPVERLWKGTAAAVDRRGNRKCHGQWWSSPGGAVVHAAPRKRSCGHTWAASNDSAATTEEDTATQGRSANGASAEHLRLHVAALGDAGCLGSAASTASGRGGSCHWLGGDGVGSAACGSAVVAAAWGGVNGGSPAAAGAVHSPNLGAGEGGGSIRGLRAVPVDADNGVLNTHIGRASVLLGGGPSLLPGPACCTSQLETQEEELQGYPATSAVLAHRCAGTLAHDKPHTPLPGIQPEPALLALALHRERDALHGRGAPSVCTSLLYLAHARL